MEAMGPWLSEEEDVDNEDEPEDEPVDGPPPLDQAVVFHTWYIHHFLWTTCESSRSVRIPAQDNDWIPHFADIWADRFDRGRLTRVTVITPQPGDGTADPHIHLMIEQ